MGDLFWNLQIIVAISVLVARVYVVTMLWHEVLNIAK